MYTTGFKKKIEVDVLVKVRIGIFFGSGKFYFGIKRYNPYCRII
jgi:hypothetical protein